MESLRNATVRFVDLIEDYQREMQSSPAIVKVRP
jgi:hypothetical protein